jgi:eukaryotic-like serine/threonine-protein kinase
MTSHNWQEVARIHEAALMRPPQEREAFVANACGSDGVLRYEVESLLAQEAKQSLLDQPLGVTAADLVPASDRLTVGEYVGEFRVEGVLGAGGMGEVYRARDTKLGRSVALKVLPVVFAGDPERLARFRREAQVLASLNDPHIAAIYGIEDQTDVSALVLELVEGATLADRIADGPLSLDEALHTARQIAAALEVAHGAGIVHRDLKPTNLKVTPGGVVKVLDFGLARLTYGEADVASGDRVVSAAMTSPVNMSAAGLILGSAAYMSPEQAKGRTADKRSDVWAFGCVLYEMLTGQRAFAGSDVAETLANVLKAEPDWSALPSSTPTAIRRLLRRSLEKDRRRRLADISDAVLEIEEGQQTDPDRGEGAKSVRMSPRWLWAFAATSVIATGIAVWTMARAPGPATGFVTRVTVNVAPADAIPPRPRTTALALSPDGRFLVFVGRKHGVSQLYLRALDHQDATPIAGTEGASPFVTPQGPFFSPDGQWIGFWLGESRIGGAVGELKKVPLLGGPSQTICKTPPLYGASWGDDGQIVYAGGEGSIGGLWRVRAEGGTPERLTTVQDQTISHRLPQWLPGSHAVLFTIQRTVRQWGDAQVVVRAIATGEQHVLVDGAADARFVPSGHLVYARGSTVYAAPFDLNSSRITGSEVAVLDGVMRQVNATSTLADTGATQFTVSGSGALAYLPGDIAPDIELPLVWIDRRGGVQPLPFPSRAYLSPRLSPDGYTIAVAVGYQNRGLWLLDLRRGSMERIGPPERVDGFPVWSPDGSAIAFAGGSPANLFVRRTDGTVERLTRHARPQIPSAWSPDGKTLAFLQRQTAPRQDIWLLSSDGKDWQVRPFLETTHFEQTPEFSPDGHWLAYVSDESGREEVYVQSFPGPGRRMQISTNGGTQPVWAHNGRELFYTVPAPTSRSWTMMAVDVVTTPTFAAAPPRRLFVGEFVGSIPTRGYDITPDGQRFLSIQAPSDTPPAIGAGATQVALILNWSEELKRRAPGRD